MIDVCVLVFTTCIASCFVLISCGRGLSDYWFVIVDLNSIVIDTYLTFLLSINICEQESTWEWN
jgi:hypothetical protein